jgi:hypothetical protein
MQQQVFQIAKPVEKAEAKNEGKAKEETDQLDLFIGLSSPLNDPFNTFFRLRDINDPNSTLIYFYIYSLGKARSILWGVYNVPENKFLIDDACKYDLRQLNEALKIWKSHGFDFVSSELKNRQSSLIAQNFLFKNRQKYAELYNQFKLYFMYNRLERGELQNIEQNNPVIAFSQKFKEEELLYGVDFDDEYKKIVDPIVASTIHLKPIKVNEIDTDTGIDYIDDRVKVTSYLQKYIPKLKNITALHIFILIMMGVEEYRAAKYIVALERNNQETDNQQNDNQQNKLEQGQIWIILS